MATLDEIAQEKQRLAERLERLDADRARLAEQVNELEIAERVLTRFGQSAANERRGRGRQARAAPVPAGGRRGRTARTAAAGLSLSDAVLQAVRANPAGLTAGDVMAYLARDLGMAVRPNHLGIALQRHRRAGRLENRDDRWHLPHSARHGDAAAGN